jgi:hypothetical protein
LQYEKRKGLVIFYNQLQLEVIEHANSQMAKKRTRRKEAARMILQAIGRIRYPCKDVSLILLSLGLLGLSATGFRTGAHYVRIAFGHGRSGAPRSDGGSGDSQYHHLSRGEKRETRVSFPFFFATSSSVSDTPFFKNETIIIDHEQLQQKQPTSRQRRVANSNVRNIMALLQSRYPDKNKNNINNNEEDNEHHKDAYSSSSSSSPWKKTRNYLYQAGDRLTVEQVREVIDFLDVTVDSVTARSIVQTAPRVLRKSVTSSLQPTSNFLLELWGPPLFQTALSRNPHLLLSTGLCYDGPERDQIERYLQETVGIPWATVQTLQKKAPFVFSLSVEKLERVLDFFRHLLHHGNCAPSKIPIVLRKLVTSYPHLLNLSVDANLEPRVDFLMQRCGLNAADMASLLQSSSGASVLGLSVSANLQPTLDYLSSIIMMGGSLETKGDEHKDLDHECDNNNDSNTTERIITAQLRKSILLHPPLLGLSLKNLQAKVKYFNLIDNPDQQPTTTTGQEPLQASLANNMSRSSITTASLASRVCIRSPAIYSLSLQDNIIPTVEFLAKVWGTVAPSVQWNETTGEMIIVSQSSAIGKDLTKNSNGTTPNLLAALLQEYPTIVTLSLQGNIQPTMNFYNRTGYVRLTDQWELIPGKGRVALIRGRYIAASLYNRLLPRWHYCYSKGTLVPSSSRSRDIDTRSGSSVDSQSSSSESSEFAAPPLHVMVSTTDEVFCSVHGFDVRDFRSFKSDAIPRLKFSSQFDTWLKTGRPIEV